MSKKAFTGKHKEYAEQLGMEWYEIYNENKQLVTIRRDALI